MQCYTQSHLIDFEDTLWGSMTCVYLQSTIKHKSSTTGSESVSPVIHTFTDRPATRPTSLLHQLSSQLPCHCITAAAWYTIIYNCIPNIPIHLFVLWMLSIFASIDDLTRTDPLAWALLMSTSEKIRNQDGFLFAHHGKTLCNYRKSLCCC